MAITSVVYLALTNHSSYVVSFLVSYIIGVGFNLYVQPRMVFKVESPLENWFRLLFVNLLLVLIGVAISLFAINNSWDRGMTLLMTATTLVPLGFIFTRIALRVT